MIRKTVSIDKEFFEEAGAWMLDREHMKSSLGDIDFDTLHFYLEDGTPYFPEGGEKYAAVLRFDSLPRAIEPEPMEYAPWLIEHQTIVIEYELLGD